MQSDQQERHTHRYAGLIPGLIVAVAGLVFLLNNLHIVPVEDLWRFWPLALIAAGVLMIVNRGTSGMAAGVRVRPSERLSRADAVAIFGGGADETLAPLAEKPGTRRLIVRGSAVFGGVSIKN